MAALEDAIENVGACGLALIRAIIINPTTKQAMITLLTMEKAAIQQSILANLEVIEQLDVASRFLDRVFTLARAISSGVSSDIAVMQPVLDAFASCPAANVVSNGITAVSDFVENGVSEALQLLTGKTESVGDLNSLAYEAQRRVTLRRAANATIVKSEEALSIIDDFILIINNL